MRRLLPDPSGDLDEVAILAAYGPEQPAERHVRVNMIATADGAAVFDGRVGTISGPTDQRMLERLRITADVILVGAGTVRAEGYGGPLLSDDGQNRRAQRGLAPHPRLAIVTGRLDLAPDAPVFTDAPARPIVITTTDALAGAPEQLTERADIVTAGETRVDLAAALDALGNENLRHIHNEGGPHLLAQLFAADLVDELCLTLAPSIAGGDFLRITSGAQPEAPMPLRLAHVMTEDGFLFLRYLRPGAHGDDPSAVHDDVMR